jgi:hypothetical protein
MWVRALAIGCALLASCYVGPGDWHCTDDSNCPSGWICGSSMLCVQGTREDDGDSGVFDAGTLDSGPLDAGPADAGEPDSGTDAGAADSGPADSGPADSGPADAGEPDSGTDAGEPDSGTDAGAADSGSDAGSSDAGLMVDAGDPHAQDSILVTTIAGNRGCDSATTGPGQTANISTTAAMVTDATGNLYIAMATRVARIDTSGNMTTLAGDCVSGYRDGRGTAAEFGSLTGIALDPDGNVYVSDNLAARIRKIDSTGLVTTFSGNGTRAVQDGTGGPDGTAEYGSPLGLTYYSGTLYVADNAHLRAVDASGAVTAARGGALLGVGNITSDPMGNIYCPDSTQRKIMKIDTAGNTSVFAGNGTSGYMDGSSSAAEFQFIYALGADGSGNIYASDKHRIRKIDSSGNVSTLAGNGTDAVLDGTAGPAGTGEISGVLALAADVSGDVYFGDVYTNGVAQAYLREASSTQIMTLLADSSVRNGTGGPAGTAELGGITGIVPGAAGTIYVTAGATVRLIDSSANVSTFAGNGSVGFREGPAAMAEFSSLAALALDSAGDVYVADNGNGRLRVIDPSGTVSTVAGGGTNSDPCQDGTTGTSGTVTLDSPWGMVVEPNFDIYFADNQCFTVRWLHDNQQQVTGIAGTPNLQGHHDAQGSQAVFWSPTGVAQDMLGNLYVADGTYIRKIDPEYNVTTIAGNSTSAYRDGPGSIAEFTNALGITVDEFLEIFVADGARIRRIDPAGNVSTVAGSVGGWRDGTQATAEFDQLRSAVFDSSGNLLVTEGTGDIREVSWVPDAGP